VAKTLFSTVLAREHNFDCDAAMASYSIVTVFLLASSKMLELLERVVVHWRSF